MDYTDWTREELIKEIQRRDGNPRGNTANMPKGFVLNTQVLTEHKRTEAEIRQKNRDLETLLHVISHDLREPLRGIQNFSRMVYERYAEKLDEKGQDFLSRIVRAAKKMDVLLDDILMLSRAQRMEKPAELIDGKAIVDNVLSRLQLKIQETGAKVTVADDLPSLRANSTWATQAVFNLVNNALKFTLDDDPPEVEVASFQRNGEVGIVVRDRGPGVNSQHSERIFQLFQRAVGQEIEGTGSGLAIVRQIAERHGGQAWMQPRAGGGSEFVVTFAQDTNEEALSSSHTS